MCSLSLPCSRRILANLVDCGCSRFGNLINCVKQRQSFRISGSLHCPPHPYSLSSFPRFFDMSALVNQFDSVDSYFQQRQGNNLNAFHFMQIDYIPYPAIWKRISCVENLARAGRRGQSCAGSILATKRVCTRVSAG